MFHYSPEVDLSPRKTLELVRLQLSQARQARDSKDADVSLVICKFADSLLASLKAVVKRPHRFCISSGSIHNIDLEQETSLCEEIANAYLDHANLMADLGKEAMAQTSRKRADKWGGPNLRKFSSDASKKEDRALDVATVSKNIFPDDVRPPTVPCAFPKPDGRVTNTLHLVSCLDLLKQGSEGIAKDVVDPAAKKWLHETENNAEERARLKALVTELMRVFENDEMKDKQAVFEVVCLVPVLEKDEYRFLLGNFLKNIEKQPILNSAALGGLAHIIQSSPSPDFLSAQDLIKVLTAISTRLQETHKQSPDQVFELTVAVSSVLDAMAYTHVSGLDRVSLHEPLLNILGELRDDDDLHLKYYASYALQALLCVPDNELPWQAAVRRTNEVLKGVSGMVSAIKGLDIHGFLASLQNGLGGVEQIFKMAQTYEAATAVFEAKQDLVGCLKRAFTSNIKCAWYSALRGADVLIEGGELAKFRTLVCGAVCRREPAFQWGVCQRLGNLAADHRWDDGTRKGAVRFLEEIYRHDGVWGPLPPIKMYILDILQQLSRMGNDLQVAKVFEELAMDGDEAKRDIYRRCVENYTSNVPRAHQLKFGPPKLGSPSLLDRVQGRTDVEADLRRIASLRREERGGAVYIPPFVKTDLRASDELFPLFPMVDQFLDGNDKVLLLLGDSGAGKTTFNRQLDLQQWEKYQPKVGRIPLLISLPAIDRPEKDLIAKHLRMCEFTEPQIRDLKERKFIIICDGYDESQQMQNLYRTNGLNKEGGWSAQMVISCRSEHLGEDYHDLFRPEKANGSGSTLFQQATLVPFSTEQVEQYITQYVDIKRPLWLASDYERVLLQIPTLRDLVTNPFLLTLSLEVLPRIADSGQKLASNRVTRVLLYDEFMVHWLEHNKKRLSAKVLTDSERRAFKRLSDDGFTQRGLCYLKDLSAAIYKSQGGNPVVEYSKERDAGTWKERFFGRNDEEIELLQTAIPMTRNGGQFGFTHRSILEYGVCRAIYEPQNRVGLDMAEEIGNNCKKSMGPAFRFEMAEEVDKATAKPSSQGPNGDSILTSRSFLKDASVLQFLVERVGQEPAFKGQLLDYIEASKVDEKWSTAAANAMTILVRAGVRFYGVDLRGIRIPGADLSGGHFDSAQLEGTDLTNTNLRNVWLRQINLNKRRGEMLLIFTGQ
ncbi:hypothetical protein EC968_006122 [Mortierella alpina]|nr:hypothetical protein EC968_006122 [Mortierella alpina]